nr:hypothetical protein [Tanacetum cinerariifolium]
MWETGQRINLPLSYLRNLVNPKSSKRLANFRTIDSGIKTGETAKVLILLSSGLEAKARDCLCIAWRLSVRLSSSVEDNLCAYDCYVNDMCWCDKTFKVATLRAVVHAGDKTSGDARSWYMFDCLIV